VHPFPSLGNRCTHSGKSVHFSGKSVHFSGKSVHFSGKSVHQTWDNSLNSKELIFLLLYYYITILPERGFFQRKIPSFSFPKSRIDRTTYPVSSDPKPLPDTPPELGTDSPLCESSPGLGNRCTPDSGRSSKIPALQTPPGLVSLGDFPYL